MLAFSFTLALPPFIQALVRMASLLKVTKAIRRTLLRLRLTLCLMETISSLSLRLMPSLKCLTMRKLAHKLKMLPSRLFLHPLMLPPRLSLPRPTFLLPSLRFLFRDISLLI